jgi:ABC-type glycerol-3-phosphate transport system permease component
MSIQLTNRARPQSRLQRISGFGRVASWVGVWLLLAMLALSAIHPLVFVALTAFRTNEDYARNPGGLPGEWTGSNIIEAVNRGNMGTYALNSLVIVAAAAALIVVFACLAAYALTQFDFPLRGSVLVAVVAMMVIPPTVLMIPIFKIVVDIGLIGTRPGLVLVYASLNLPFSIYLMTAYMRSIPREIIHAARVDGASAVRTLWSIVLPLVRPALLTLVTLNFLILWNELLFSLLILQEDEKRTLMVGVALLQGEFRTDIGAVASGLLLSMIPPVLIFALFQRDLARGLTSGAVK